MEREAAPAAVPRGVRGRRGGSNSGEARVMFRRSGAVFVAQVRAALL